jgi:hypothetical protein
MAAMTRFVPMLLVAALTALSTGCRPMPAQAATRPTTPASTSPAPAGPSSREDRDGRVGQLLARLHDAERGTGTRRVWYDADGAVVGLLLTTTMATNDSVGLLPAVSRRLRSLTVYAPAEPIEGRTLLRALAQLPELESLVLCGSPAPVDAELIRGLAPLDKLTSLSIRYAAVTPDAVGELARLGSLRELEISSIDGFGDEQVRAVSGATGLRRLDLSSTGVTDACLPQLRRLPHLAELVVRNTRVTRRGVADSGLAAKVQGAR